jgi:hypothetical protein
LCLTYNWFGIGAVWDNGGAAPVLSETLVEQLQKFP